MNNVLTEVRNFAEQQLEHLYHLNKIGSALSAEKDINKIFEMIIDEAMKFTSADGGTIYVLSNDERNLEFAIAVNISLKVRKGGTYGKIDWPPVPMYDKYNNPNHHNVSTYVAHTGKAMNIEDVYDLEGFDMSGTKKYDEANDYRSKSMLVIPMRNHEDDIIGVLQLINAQDNNWNVIPFSKEKERLVLSLASQAAVALTNKTLIKGLQDLLEAFIKSIANAIDKKSAYTGEHIRKVAELTMMIANAINNDDENCIGLHFSDDQLTEIRIAGWMHDIGKIITPEAIMDKSTKLQTIFDRIELIDTRFQAVKKEIKIRYLTKELEMYKSGNIDEDKIKQLHKDLDFQLAEIDNYLEFLRYINIGREKMDNKELEKLEHIASKKIQWNDNDRLLNNDELENLSIRKGTLTGKEFSIMKAHAYITERMLIELPFPKKMRNIPLFASAHHERLDGTGYPHGLKGKEIPLQSRIIAIADIYEALVAQNRPYKKGKTLSEALSIMANDVKNGKIDKDIFELFIDKKIYLEYAKKEINPSQIDEVNIEKIKEIYKK
ncbi:MAG: metal-dependent phosphohydrolase [Candidatus Cloacimonadota bacterium]|nr:MAG: metal-dependent phosphohydrolase [Candidatus Cloacimonadota bacterium]